jgi:imidazolonepropionase-like amidohydrolase
MPNLVLAALVLTVLGAARAGDAQVIAISADRLIDVTAGRIVQQPLVVVTDGRITAAGPRGDVQVPAGARRIDLPGMTLLPGLIDMHVHLDTDPSYGGYTGLQFNDRF